METRNRLKWIDCAKGFAILCVVLGHSFRTTMFANNEFAFLLYKSIYYFHMPLFFFISGYLSLSSQKKDFLVKKTNSLIVPWVFYSILIYVIFFICTRVPVINELMKNSSYYLFDFKDYVSLCIKGSNPYAFHLWYLEVLFLIQVVYWIASCLIKYKYAESVLFVSSVLLYMTAFKIFPENIDTEYMALNMVMKETVFFAAGRIWRKYKLLDSQKTSHIFMLIGGLLVFLWYTSKPQSPLLSYVGTVIYYLLEVMILFSKLIIVQFICLCCKKVPNSLFRYFGRNSFIIYLIHQPFFCGFFGMLLYDKFGMGVWCTVLLCFFFSIFFPIVAKVILSRFGAGRWILSRLFNYAPAGD